MAEYYCDISAVGNEYQAYAATPTWGAAAGDKPLPMDGTGKAGSGHSAAVAIAEIQITVLPGDTNTLTIAGAVLTAKTTAAAKNQWTISGAISTCITNLRDLINTFGTGTAQCDASVNSGSSALTLALPYWCFARVKPGTTDTLQIATRLAGSDMNQATNANVAISSSGWATPPTLTQFTGSADGPFAYLYNTATVFGKSDAQASGSTPPLYGLFFNAAGGPSDPGATDVVHCRTKRSGSNLSHTAWVATGSSSATGSWKSRNYLFDDGTLWSGDNGRLSVSFKRNVNNSQTIAFSIPGASLSFVSRAVGGFEITGALLQGTATSTSLFRAAASGSLVFQRCRFIEGSDHSASLPLTLIDSSGSVAGLSVDLSESFLQFRGAVTSTKLISTLTGSGTTVNFRLHGTQVEIVAATGAIGVLINHNSLSSFCVYEWVGGSVYDTNGVYRCQNPITPHTSSEVEVVIDNVVGITDPSVSWTASSTSKASLRWVQADGTYKAFRYQTPRYAVDWKGDGTFPYAGAAADLRGNGWAHRVTWTAIPTNAAPVMVLRLAHFYRSAAASKTVKLSLYVPDATTFYQDELEFEITYTDSGGTQRTEKAAHARAQAFMSSRTALSSDSASWTTNGVTSHSAKKVELTTAYSIKQDSEIVARVSLAASRSPSVVFYASPELVLS